MIHMNIINNIDELPNNASIHIYGAGSFGMMLHDSIVFYRPDIKIINFIDSFKTGAFLNSPIINIQNFIDNDEYFPRKQMLHKENGSLMKNNDGP